MSHTHVGKLYTFEISNSGVGGEAGAQVRSVGNEKLQAFTGVVDVEDTHKGQDRMIAGFRVCLHGLSALFHALKVSGRQSFDMVPPAR